MKLITLLNSEVIEYDEDKKAFSSKFISVDGEFPETDKFFEGNEQLPDVSEFIKLEETSEGVKVTMEYLPYYDESYGPHANKYAGAVTGGFAIITKFGEEPSPENIGEEAYTEYTELKGWGELAFSSDFFFKEEQYTITAFFSTD
jgi:hypothetical protein